MEVHVLLLTDMLLICKLTTKKMFKIIRQPYVVDRIRIHEVKEPSSLGLVYLNEYGTVSAALILSAGDPKLAKVTRQISRITTKFVECWFTVSFDLDSAFAVYLH